jgi:hypothetical protein
MRDSVCTKFPTEEDSSPQLADDYDCATKTAAWAPCARLRSQGVSVVFHALDLEAPAL